MSLEDTFGEDFAEQIRQKTAERRQDRNRITGEQKKDICSLAINQSKFEDGDPQFQYKTDNGVTHDVLLMQVPEPDRGTVWDHLGEPWDGAAKLPLDYLGEWHWSTFPEKEEVKKLESGEWYIVIGNVEENEADNGDVFKNIYPVRGIASLEEAQQYAEEGMDEEGFSSDEEDEASSPEDFAPDEDEDEEEVEEDTSDEEEEDEKDEEENSSGGGLGSLIDDDEDDDDEEEEESSPVPYEPVAHFIEDLSEKQDEDEEPQIFEITEEHAQLGKLASITVENLDLDSTEEDVKEVILDVIEEHREEEDEEEEEEDDLSGNLF